MTRVPLLTAGIAALAFLIRIPDLRWGLPEVEEEATPVHKAFAMWGWDEGRVTLDPQTSDWPAFSFYAHLALQHVQYAVGRMTGRYDDRLDFFVEHVDAHTLMAPARFLSVLLGVAVVVVGVRLARRLAGWFGALTTGLVLAASPLLIEHSIRAGPDIFLTLFSALALASILDVYEKRRLRYYLWSAVWIALGVASKYTPVLLIPCLVSAHVARQWRKARWRSLIDRRLLLAGATCAAVVFAATPFTFLNVAVAQRDFPLQFGHVVTAGHFGHELRGPGHVFYLVEALPHALGWPAMILGLSGLVLAAWRRRGVWLLVLLSFALYWVGLGALRSLHEHYILPAVLPVALGLAALAAELRRASWTRGPRTSVALAFALLAVAVTPAGLLSARQHQRFSRPSTFADAKALIMELDVQGALFVAELGGPTLPRDPYLEFQGRPVFQRLDPADRERVLSRPFVHKCQIPMYMTDANRADFYYDLRHYVDHDYIVVAGTARDRYVALVESYPRQNEFYGDLDRYRELVRRFPASPDRRGADVWIYRVLPGTRRILDDRGRLERGFHNAWHGKVLLHDLSVFLTFVAVAAAQRDNWESADLYLSTLVDVTPRDRLQDELLFALADMKYKAGNLLEAEQLCNELLQRHPDQPNLVALRAEISRRAAPRPRVRRRRAGDRRGMHDGNATPNRVRPRFPICLILGAS
ncbi:MAG: glycosyltransferase family 39 protein [bacterium]